jgi:hypothetical protein
LEIFCYPITKREIASDTKARLIFKKRRYGKGIFGGRMREMFDENLEVVYVLIREQAEFKQHKEREEI